MQVAVLDNSARKDFSPLDRANAIRSFERRGYRGRELAALMGLSKRQKNNLRRLLDAAGTDLASNVVRLRPLDIDLRLLSDDERGRLRGELENLLKLLAEWPRREIDFPPRPHPPHPDHRPARHPLHLGRGVLFFDVIVLSSTRVRPLPAARVRPLHKRASRAPATGVRRRRARLRNPGFVAGPRRR